MRLYGIETYYQLFGNLLVREPGSDQSQNFQFAFARFLGKLVIGRLDRVGRNSR